MSVVEFQPAVRKAISLLIGLAGGTGSGKTYSAMRIAKGLAGDERFGVIDTENGRALHYADDFAFDHAPLEPPFSPARYLAALRAADARGYPVIVVDSASHEHAGTGGLLDMHDEELARRGGGENQNMAAWILPKREHGKYRDALLAMRAHVVLCFRAEPKVEMRKNERGKFEIVPKTTLTGLDGWIPISEKNLPFELTVSFLLMADAPGIPKPIKLEERLRAIVPLDVELAEGTGVALATWARGTDLPAESTAPDTSPLESTTPPGALSEELEAVARRLIAAGSTSLAQMTFSVANTRGRDVPTYRTLSALIADLSAEEQYAYLTRLLEYETKQERARSDS